MTTTEHLSRIRAKCVELLEIASKRTKGKWGCDGHNIKSAGRYMGHLSSAGTYAFPSEANARFIAACAGPAEAGWKSTIAAIDWAVVMLDCSNSLDAGEQRMVDEILAAWPEETL